MSSRRSSASNGCSAASEAAAAALEDVIDAVERRVDRLHARRDERGEVTRARAEAHTSNYAKAQEAALKRRILV